MNERTLEKAKLRCWQCSETFVTLRRVLTDGDLNPIKDLQGNIQITPVTTEVCGNRSCILWIDIAKIRTWRRT